MATENILSEWKACRATISRFDGHLLRTRLVGASVFTLIFTAMVMRIGAPGISLMDAPTALLLCIATIHILDRYYQRMLLMAVSRALHLEAHRPEGLRIGSTAGTGAGNEQSDQPHWSAKFARPSLTADFVYGLMLVLIVAAYATMTWHAIHRADDLIKTMPFAATVIAVMAIFVASGFLLGEQRKNIEKSAKVAASPIVYSKIEINAAINGMAQQICAWIHSEGIKTLNVISVLTGARQLTQALLSRMHEISPDADFRVLPVSVEATRNNIAGGEASIRDGAPTSETLGARPTLIVDDLVDTGASLELLKSMVEDLGVTDIKTAALINKYDNTRFKADFVGFDLGLKKNELVQRGISDYWLFGFGMDIDGKYREVEHIGWVPMELRR